MGIVFAAACALLSATPVEAPWITRTPYVYVSESYRACYVVHAKQIDFYADNRHSSIDRLQGSPAGQDLGIWSQTRRLKYLNQKVGRANSAVLYPLNLPVDGVTNWGGEAGWIGTCEIKAGPSNASGSLIYAILNKHNAGGAQISSERLYPVGPLSIIEFGKRYQNKYTQLSLEPVGENNGTLIIQGRKFAIKTLKKSPTRYIFTATDWQTGSPAGFGAYEWAPTEAGAKKLMDKEWGSADRVILDCDIPGFLKSAGGAHEELILG